MLVTLLLLGVLTGTAPLLPSPAVAAGLTTGQPPVAVLLSALEPRAPRATDVLTVQVRLRNDGDAPVRDLRVQLGVGARLSTRSGLSAADAGVGTEIVRVATTVELPDVLTVGGSLLATLAVPVAELRLGRLGVYPLQVAVSGRTSTSRRTLGGLTTYLPWFPDGVESPVRVAFVLPLAAQPDRSLTSGVLTDDLTADLAPQGRLGALLAAGVAAQDQGAGTAAPPAPAVAPTAPAPAPTAPAAATTPVVPAATLDPVPLTWAVDPALLSALATMSGEYRLDPGAAAGSVDAEAVPGTGQQAARQYLAALVAATSGRPLLALPYADVDTVALERQGLGEQALAAQRLGAQIVGTALPAARRLTTAAWPVGGAVSDDALALLAGAGVRAFVLSDRSLGPDGTLTYSPGAKSELAAGLVAAVTDSGLDGLIVRQSGTPEATPGEPPPGRTLAATIAAEQAAPRQAEQRFLAETALIAAERGVPRDFVVTPPRRWAPDPAYVAAVLALPGRVPWLTGTTLDAVLAGATPDAARGSLRYPAEAQAAELSASALAGTRSLTTQLDSVTSALTDPSLLAPAQNGLLASLSSAWRDKPSVGRDLRRGVSARLAEVTGAVRITTVGRVTLTSSTGQIPVTVSNDLPQPVMVRLQVRARQVARLTDSDAGQTVRIAAGSRQTLTVTAMTRTSGTFPVEIRLLTPQGVPLGPATELLLTSTAYGRTALGITLAALAVLLVAVGVRLTRRAMHSRAAPGRHQHQDGVDA